MKIKQTNRNNENDSISLVNHIRDVKKIKNIGMVIEFDHGLGLITEKKLKKVEQEIVDISGQVLERKIVEDILNNRSRFCLYPLNQDRPTM